MAGKYEIKALDSGKYRFSLKAGNGEIIAVSQSYATLASCKKGIESVKRASATTKLEDQTEEGFKTVTNPKFEIYVDNSGEYRFRLKARNGEIIATGEGYKAKQSCIKGIASIQKNADSPIVRLD